MASAVARIIVCGSSTCPTCGRPTEALIGPCDGCDESFRKTGRFLRSVSRKAKAAPQGEGVRA